MKIPAFMLNKVVTVKPYNGRNAYGPVYGGPIQLDPNTIVSQDDVAGTYEVKCRCELRKAVSQRRQTTANSKEIVKLGKIWFNGTYLRPESIITIDGDDYFVGECTPQGWLGPRVAHIEVVLV